jgi:exopolyphosphatase / guanosine-5'-triphosphate,3'-diphosphate pyrophosphatase
MPYSSTGEGGNGLSCDRMTRGSSVNTGRPVGVIDIGSNTIKLLVAGLSSLGDLKVLHERSDDTRISCETSSDEVRLTEHGMNAGVKAVSRLISESLPHEPVDFRIVATGLIRESVNGKLFAERVREDTGYEVDIISGDEEALGIACGVGADALLPDESNYLIADLGGGSLELILVENRTVRTTLSLPLGAVLMSKRFVRNSSAPYAESDLDAISAHVRQKLSACAFPFPASPFFMVATGGAFAAVRAVFAKAKNILFDECSVLASSEISSFLSKSFSLTIDERVVRFPPLSTARADIMPTALRIMLTLLEHSKASEIHHSLRNLRFGLAAKLLDPAS